MRVFHHRNITIFSQYNFVWHCFFYVKLSFLVGAKSSAHRAFTLARRSAGLWFFILLGFRMTVALLRMVVAPLLATVARLRTGIARFRMTVALLRMVVAPLLATVARLRTGIARFRMDIALLRAGIARFRMTIALFGGAVTYLAFFIRY
jgi:hypothetical protein